MKRKIEQILSMKTSVGKHECAKSEWYGMTFREKREIILSINTQWKI